MNQCRPHPLIRIVTPVRNGERYLGETIESVLGQTMPDWEYVIVDGGSSDHSREIAEAYAAREPRIDVISEPDHGIYDALLKGLERSRAPICCWINADDRLMPWAFELVARYVALTGARWVTGLPACMDAAGLVHTVDGVKWYPRQLIRAGLFHTHGLGFVQQEGTFFARDLLKQVDAGTLSGIRRSRLAGDFLLWRAFAARSSLHLLPTVLGVYRWHGQNLGADLDAYRAELAAAGVRLTPRALQPLLKALFLPAALLALKLRLRRWRRELARLPSLERVEPAPARSPAAAKVVAEPSFASIPAKRRSG